MDDPPSIEKARAARIERNKAVLRSLGIPNLSDRLVEEGVQPRPRVKRKAEYAPEEHQPVRRSRRQAKAKADAEGGSEQQGHEEEPLISLEDRVSRHVHPAQSKVIIHDKAGRMKSTEDMDEVRAHNLMRLRTMSHKALTTRVNKISNREKLTDFMTLLEEEGMDDLAQLARDRLAQMGGS